jgi:hypothetical protein
VNTIYEDEVLRHRFGQEEYDLLMPDFFYREFGAAQR